MTDEALHQIIKPELEDRVKRRVYTCDGPSNTWHTDGNDKLQPYELLIHGCVMDYREKFYGLK